MTYLAHHGILGQKWGIRRYQNKDGTLTEAGKKRYKTDGSLSYDEARLKYSSNQKDRDSYNKILRDETDTRHLSGKEKTKREEEILSTWTKDNPSERELDRIVQLQKRVETESGDWYNSQPVSAGFKANEAERDYIDSLMDLGEQKVRSKYQKRLDELQDIMDANEYRDRNGYLRSNAKGTLAFAKWDKTYNKMSSEIKAYRNSDEYKKLASRKSELANDLLGIVLKDIGYEDTPTNRRLIESMVFWD